jgi:Fur family zinc uptake transcriptional regulator
MHVDLNHQKSMTKNQRHVLEALRQAGRPMSAYELIDRLEPHGMHWPPTVYRALKNLVERGLVHRVESLNAFVLCDHPHDERSGKAAGLVAFALCRECGAAQEFDEPHIAEGISAWSAGSGFALESMVVELHGLCAACKSNQTARGAML